MMKAKLLKAMMVGAMALGVVGTAAVADIPGLSQKADASAISWGVNASYSNGIAYHQYFVVENNPSISHLGKYVEYEVIHKATGQKVQTGSTPFQTTATVTGGTRYSTATLNTSLAGKPSGTYEIWYYYTIGGVFHAEMSTIVKP